jgi:hypothetical protein
VIGCALYLKLVPFDGPDAAGIELRTTLLKRVSLDRLERLEARARPTLRLDDVRRLALGADGGQAQTRVAIPPPIRNERAGAGRIARVNAVTGQVETQASRRS